MPLEMNREVFITCAVTGSGGSQDQSPHVPRSPKQIADSAIAAARAGAAVVHCHVRDPATGKPSRSTRLYREVTDRIRDTEVDVVLEPDRRNGGRSGVRLSGLAAASGRRNRHGRCRGTRRTCRRMPAGDLHARLRHDELRRGRLRHDQHARHAERDGRTDDGNGCALPRSRRSIWAICGWRSVSWRTESSNPPHWCSFAWACRGRAR